MSNDFDEVLASRARRAAAAARKPPSSMAARVKLGSTRNRANAAKDAEKLVGAVSAKRPADTWEIIVDIEETKPGGQVDLLLRREQARALHRLAARHAGRAQDRQTVDEE